MMLHPQLAKDCCVLGAFPLSLVLLMNDAQYPWVILVPQRLDVREIHHLPEADQQQLMRESCAVSKVMELLYKPDSMNVAALGNVVAQLHVHHVARFVNDRCWPAPVWGRLPALAYAEHELLKTKAALRSEFACIENLLFSLC
ncbi:MAG: diadenosine tetraphosphate hydrolase [Zetaproteobacteria bacterium CG_4_9_14_3_um_filter_49_83]|nr:MAG: hypothetical protein AUJ56_06945 [Zetaproteobacteria bacterium CG1_02_49_23]PIQ30644.1 MAG: diadenosine tetraphosphate hydrolase [Zetaproteobacteria bacterium CG17_big_fil_post_rev_8_21_14_2_50_50_13]PIV30196.1 MAG: diadenosine tetraphosphate hydrolase [Zetaproteobacteria bacterium CG02_land_8_20_14_3_00_50_9]PIY55106.1 MAG: diadenosine tetraphosphate hydrolase [Zetaproteobacteria bacterium CG_4_10_14_0_8_um_filter_49_80]PJA35283.1 MAG: diadenosine tetraphosphate hydrolase [Zetaproteoba